MESTWREFFEELVLKAGTAAKLAAALKWSDTKVSRLRAYQGSFPNGAETLALAAYAGVPPERVAILVAKAEALWLAGKPARLEARGANLIQSTMTKPGAKVTNSRLYRGPMRSAVAV
jgi:hypothetical protein